MKEQFFVLLLFSITMIFGCSTTNYIPIKEGMLITPNLRIEAADGSFTILSGKTFVPPFRSDLKDNWRYFLDENLLNTSTIDYVINHSGAKKVKVYSPLSNKPLYGILALSGVAETAKGPASRSYAINISDETISNAFNGKISVCFENYDWTDNSGCNHYWRSWILWLSDKEF